MLTCLSTVGCGAYRLRGTILDGQLSAVLLVDHDDPRLKQVGLGGAVIELTLDPNSMHPRPLGAAMTGRDGEFDIPIDQAGAGVLEYQLGIMCRLDGYRTIWQIIQLPSSKRQLLIIMTPGPHGAPGPSRVPPNQDILKDTLQMQDRWLE